MTEDWDAGSRVGRQGKDWQGEFYGKEGSSEVGRFDSQREKVGRQERIIGLGGREGG